MQSVPFLGPWGQVVLIAVTVFLAFLGWRRGEWRSASEATQRELAVVRETNERLSKENRVLISDNATLRARTDLQPLVDSIQAWTVEGRGRFLEAMERLEMIHSEQTRSMTKVIDHLTSLTDQVVALTAQLSHKQSSGMPKHSTGPAR